MDCTRTRKMIQDKLVIKKVLRSQHFPIRLGFMIWGTLRYLEFTIFYHIYQENNKNLTEFFDEN
ncbi:hypothetical protein BpHYR1_001830 [Brachionus plicatilis]|uniref:Uncharacterized protein n=1 Tax=Brachionus plicatilis TaxID=10195 RepID=A0A3M7SKS1_BRAPC|nr:hypothetical protein BpHYR1_001830 [Brachionus plicatilis]